MKRFYAVIAALLICISSIAPLKAQEDKGLQIRYGAGFLSVPDYISVVLLTLSSINFTGDIYRTENFIPVTSLNVDMEYYFNPRVSLGGSLSFGGGTTRSFLREEDGRELVDKASSFYPSLLLSSSTHYVRKEKFTMYGHWGLGATLLFFHQNDQMENYSSFDAVCFPNANVYPLCFAWGKNAGFYAELGWGAKGFINIGGHFLLNK